MNLGFGYKDLFILVLIYLVPLCASFDSQCPNLKSDLKAIRKRRHILFPDGSTAAITLSLAKSFLTHVPSGWFFASDIDVLFPLPDQEFVSQHLRRKLHHKQKREIWERLKDALDLHNMNGQACVLRSICEANTHLAPPGRSLVHDILRVLLIAPLGEKEFAEEVKEMYGDISDPTVCQRMNECPFSILSFLLAFNDRKRY